MGSKKKPIKILRQPTTARERTMTQITALDEGIAPIDSLAGDGPQGLPRPARRKFRKLWRGADKYSQRMNKRAGKKTSMCSERGATPTAADRFIRRMVVNGILNKRWKQGEQPSTDGIYW